MKLSNSIIRLTACILLLLQGCAGTGNTGEETAGQTLPYRVLNQTQSVCDSQYAQNETLFVYLEKEYLWRDTLPDKSTLLESPTLSDLADKVREAAPNDKWTGVLPLSMYQHIFQDGRAASIGFDAEYDKSQHAYIITYVNPDATAKQMGFSRGDRITHINGLPADQAYASSKERNRPIFSASISGETYAVTRIDRQGLAHSSVIASEQIPTPYVRQTDVIGGTKTVGYMAYSQFNTQSVGQLNAAFKQFKDQSVQSLILDLRFNRGGDGSIANQLASQIAGEHVRGNIFNQFIFNDMQTNKSGELYFNLGQGRHILNLTNVVILTNQYTASSAEMLINALKPFVHVTTIGEVTHGKPVGMQPVVLCDSIILAVNHYNYNANGEGEFFEGIAPDCPVSDVITNTYTHDPVYQKAMAFIETGRCDL